MSIIENYTDQFQQGSLSLAMSGIVRRIQQLFKSCHGPAPQDSLLADYAVPMMSIGAAESIWTHLVEL